MFTSLTTERLVLRRLTVDDAPVLAAYRRDPEVARYQGWSVADVDGVAAFIGDLDAVEPGRPRGPWFQIGIEERASGALVGDCAVRVRSEQPGVAEIGYTLARRFQRHGFATEAVRALCTWVFAELAIERIMALTDARNLASIAVLRRLGAVRVACVEAKFRGERCVELWYELQRAPALR